MSAVPGCFPARRFAKSTAHQAQVPRRPGRARTAPGPGSPSRIWAARAPSPRCRRSRRVGATPARVASLWPRASSRQGRASRRWLRSPVSSSIPPVAPPTTVTHSAQRGAIRPT